MRPVKGTAAAVHKGSLLWHPTQLSNSAVKSQSTVTAAVATVLFKIIFTIFAPVEGSGYVFRPDCLSVCLLDYSKSYRIFGGVRHSLRTK